MNGLTLKTEDEGTVWPLLMMASGYAAMERGSESIELRDLLKAIYIVDLEHASRYWSSWEMYETLVSGPKISAGPRAAYINRILYLVRLDTFWREEEGLKVLGHASNQLLEVLTHARSIATERNGVPASPSTKDLLFAIFSADPEISGMLQESGLQVETLKRDVKR
jgi:hypothetical protein